MTIDFEVFMQTKQQILDAIKQQKKTIEKLEKEREKIVKGVETSIIKNVGHKKIGDLLYSQNLLDAILANTTEIASVIKSKTDAINTSISDIDKRIEALGKKSMEREALVDRRKELVDELKDLGEVTYLFAAKHDKKLDKDVARIRYHSRDLERNIADVKTLNDVILSSYQKIDGVELGQEQAKEAQKQQEVAKKEAEEKLKAEQKAAEKRISAMLDIDDEITKSEEKARTKFDKQRAEAKKEEQDVLKAKVKEGIKKEEGTKKEADKRFDAAEKAFKQLHVEHFKDFMSNPDFVDIIMGSKTFDTLAAAHDTELKRVITKQTNFLTVFTNGEARYRKEFDELPEGRTKKWTLAAVNEAKGGQKAAKEALEAIGAWDKDHHESVQKLQAALTSTDPKVVTELQKIRDNEKVVREFASASEAQKKANVQLKFAEVKLNLVLLLPDIVKGLSGAVKDADKFSILGIMERNQGATTFKLVREILGDKSLSIGAAAAPIIVGNLIKFIELGTTLPGIVRDSVDVGAVSRDGADTLLTSDLMMNILSDKEIFEMLYTNREGILSILSNVRNDIGTFIRDFVPMNDLPLPISPAAIVPVIGALTKDPESFKYLHGLLDAIVGDFTKNPDKYKPILVALGLGEVAQSQALFGSIQKVLAEIAKNPDVLHKILDSVPALAAGDLASLNPEKVRAVIQDVRKLLSGSTMTQVGSLVYGESKKGLFSMINTLKPDIGKLLKDLDPPLKPFVAAADSALDALSRLSTQDMTLVLKAAQDFSALEPLEAKQLAELGLGILNSIGVQDLLKNPELVSFLTSAKIFDLEPVRTVLPFANDKAKQDKFIAGINAMIPDVLGIADRALGALSDITPEQIGLVMKAAFDIENMTAQEMESLGVVALDLVKKVDVAQLLNSSSVINALKSDTVMSVVSGFLPFTEERNQQFGGMIQQLVPHVAGFGAALVSGESMDTITSIIPNILGLAKGERRDRDMHIQKVMGGLHTILSNPELRDNYAGIAGILAKNEELLVQTLKDVIEANPRLRSFKFEDKHLHNIVKVASDPKMLDHVTKICELVRGGHYVKAGIHAVSNMGLKREALKVVVTIAKESLYPGFLKRWVAGKDINNLLKDAAENGKDLGELCANTTTSGFSKSLVTGLNFSDQTIQHSLVNQTLSGFNFAGAYFKGENKGMDLRNAKLENCDFSGIIFIPKGGKLKLEGATIDSKTLESLLPLMEAGKVSIGSGIKLTSKDDIEKLPQAMRDKAFVDVAKEKAQPEKTMLEKVKERAESGGMGSRYP